MQEGDKQTPPADLHRMAATHKCMVSPCAVQIMRWQQDEASGKQPSSADSSAAGSSPVSGLPSLPVILQHPSQEPAAMAVLAALYGVKPIKDLLSELQGEQQLQAALLADMWQIPAVSTAAVQLLVDAAKGPGLSEAATKAFLGLSAIPNCLLPVFARDTSTCLRWLAGGNMCVTVGLMLSSLEPL